MTKRLMVVAACAAAFFAVAGIAQASSSLTLSNAQKLATRLARLQTRDRNVISFHILKGRRQRSGAFVFPYNDRTADHVFCTAQIVVTQKTKSNGGFTRFAKFQHQHCAGIPSVALSFESTTRGAQRALRGTALATAESLRSYRASLRPCARLRIPRSRAVDAAELLAIGQTEAIELPNDVPLGHFVSLLVGVNATSQPVLRNGATAWLDFVSVLRALPDVPDACGSLRRWSQNHWVPSAAPIDFASALALNGRAVVDAQAIGAATAQLARFGVFPTTVLAFTPDGLLPGLTPKFAVVG